MPMRWTLSIACVVIALLSLPLILRRVGPNRVYGFVTARTLASRDAWFAANRVGGCWLLAASLVGALGVWLAPERWIERDWLPTLIVLVPVGVAFGAALLQLRCQR